MPFEMENQDMKTQSIRAKLLTQDATGAMNERRFRNILANSGEVMESGEVRDIANLYVMGYDGELYRIADLNKNPEQQTERYSVKAQADHGATTSEGYTVPSIEKQFGSCRVWLEEDGLHARMYFANDDKLADHAWAISEDASYSIGADWYPEGYDGVGMSIDEPIGILREISMVLTGNDPRATTIDQLDSEAEAQGSAEESIGKDNIIKGEDSMIRKIDELTPDENAAIKRDIEGVVDAFTTDAPESQTEPTAVDSKDEGEAEAVEQTTDTLRSPVIIIKDRAQQEAGVATADWRTTMDAKKTFAKLAGEHRRFDAGFKADWARELGKHHASTEDGISGLGLPIDGRKLIINAINEGTTDSARILSHFRNLGGKSYFINLLTAVGAEEDAETARAHGHKKGDTKAFQSILATPRTIYNKMTYKMLDLDAMEVYENPELVSIRAEELVNNILAEWARAAIIGDGRTEPVSGADYRMFDGTRGFYSIAADAAAQSGFGAGLATAITVAEGQNLYDASIDAENAITAEGGLIYVAKKEIIKDFRQAKKSNGDYIVPVGVRIEDILGATAVYTPSWMQFADVDVVVFANNSYGLTGESNPTLRPDFNVLTNTDILLAEAPRGGSLIANKAAATLTFGSKSE